MSQLPSAANATIDGTKITDYLLEHAHPIGGGKARFFELFGYTKAKSADFKRALLDHPLTNEVLSNTTNRYGEKYTVGCSLSTPDGRNPCIVSIWIIEPPNTNPRLVTAYPADAPAPSDGP